jgi:transposase
MRPYSMDLRERVLQDADAGESTRAVALKYNVSESWVRRLKQRRREKGEIAPRSSRNGRSAKWLPWVDEIETLVHERPDITLCELRDALGKDISIQSLSRALHSLQLTFKKK